MIIGERLRGFREEKKLSQGDIEQRTGLLRCYVSRVENGHTVPSVETLEKLLALWKCRYTNCFTMERIHLSYRSRLKRLTRPCGVTLARMSGL